MIFGLSVIICPIADIYFLLNRKMTNGQLYTGVNILAEGPSGMFFKGE